MVGNSTPFLCLLWPAWCLGGCKLSFKGPPRAPKKDPKITENRSKIHSGSPWHSLGCQGVPRRCLRMHIYAYLCIFCAYLCIFMHILAILLQYLCIFMHVFISFMHIYAYFCKCHPYLCIFVYIYSHWCILMNVHIYMYITLNPFSIKVTETSTHIRMLYRNYTLARWRARRCAPLDIYIYIYS